MSAISSVHIIKCNLRKVGDDQPKNIPHTRKGNAPKKKNVKQTDFTSLFYD